MADLSTEEKDLVTRLREHDFDEYWCGENGLFAQAANEIERLRERERTLLDAHTGCGCEPTCKVCVEKGFT